MADCCAQIRAELAGLRASVNTLETKFIKTSERSAIIRESRAGMATQTEVNNLRSQVNTLNNQLQVARLQLANLRGKYAGLNNQLAALKSKVRDLENCTGCGGSRRQNQDRNKQVNEEAIIKKAVQRTYSDQRWKDNETVLTFIIKGKV